MPAVSPSAVDPLLKQHDSLRRLLPSMRIQGRAVGSLIEAAGWRRVVVLGSDDSYGVFGLLSLEQQLISGGVDVQLHMFPAWSPDEARLSLRQWRKEDQRVFVLHAHEPVLERLLAAAADEGLWGEGRVFVLAYFNDEYWARDPSALYKYVGLLGVRPRVSGVSEMEALTHDAVVALAHAVEAVPGASAGFTSLNCSIGDGAKWSLGHAVVTALRNVRVAGLSGNISFDGEGERLNVQYELLNVQSAPLRTAEIVSVASLGNAPDWVTDATPDKIQWRAETSPGFISSWPPSNVQVANREFHVLTKVAEPFVIADKDGTIRGYSIDILEALAARLNFTTRIDLFPGTGTSDMLRELVSANYSIAIAAITITGERSTWLDFTQPYYHLGYRLLVRHSGFAETSLWAFFRPFSIEVWVLWVGVTVIVAVLYSAFEKNVSKVGSRWAGPFGTGLWFAATVMLQEPDAMPRTVPGRILGVASLFMSMIFVSAYTASLAAFLSNSEALFVASSYHDIIDGKVEPHRVGIIPKTSYAEWFERVVPTKAEPRSVSSYQELYDELAKGVIDVTVIDSPIAEFAARNCSLVARGAVFEPAGYGIALPPGSPFTEALSSGLLELKREGVGSKLYEKYFTQRDCNSQETSEAQQLTGVHLAGALTFTAFCIAIAVAIYGCRLLRRRYRRRQAERAQAPVPDGGGAERVSKRMTVQFGTPPDVAREGGVGPKRRRAYSRGSRVFSNLVGTFSGTDDDEDVKLAAPYTAKGVRAEVDRHRRVIDEHQRALWQLIAEALPAGAASRYGHVEMAEIDPAPPTPPDAPVFGATATSLQLPSMPEDELPHEDISRVTLPQTGRYASYRSDDGCAQVRSSLRSPRSKQLGRGSSSKTSGAVELRTPLLGKGGVPIGADVGTVSRSETSPPGELAGSAGGSPTSPTILPLSRPAQSTLSAGRARPVPSSSSVASARIQTI
eukprot:TRINITY_DN26170_c0_g1_i1.p1 TRINITY_DN26170_c0_g1~~TRINITY_DN26170_c0_g1_i1.p1  ORF type:complete len:1076 (+),score=295.29 TRINITY_DN26170_c0_g1_i1:347-3229(+)